MSLPLRTLVIGVGNPWCGDDAVGRLVVRRLLHGLPAGVAAVEHDGEVAGLVELLRSARRVILVDAMRSGAEPGTVRRLSHTAELQGEGLAGISSHGQGVVEAIRLARALGWAPDLLAVYGVEGRNWAPGDELSGSVAGWVAGAAAAILAEVR